MKRVAPLIAALAGALAGQDAPVPRGAYRFIQLSYSDGAKPGAVSTGGVITFDGSGAAQWGDKTARYEAAAPYEGALSAGAVKLSLRLNQDASVLIGSAALQPGTRHHLFVAVRGAEGVSPLALRGNYGIAALTLRKGETAGLATAFAQLTASGMGQFTRAILTGHAAEIDDVVRREERTGLTYELTSDGTGVAHLSSGSDVLNGDLRIAVSGDGGILLGWSADPANPGILLGVRKSAEAATFSFQGRFWITELAAENSFVFQQSTRLSSSAGSLASNRTGLAYISEHILSGGESSYLATTNQYRVGSDGVHALGPKLEAGVDNFAFNESAFVSAQTGAPGSLTLAHGVAFGVAAPFSLPQLSSAASPALPDAPVVPGALMSLSGMFAEGAKVRINGADAPLGAAAPDRLQFQVPASFEGNSVTIDVLAGGKITQTLRACRAASSPVLFTAEGTGTGVAAAAHADGTPVALLKPAEPGEAVTFTVTGLGEAPTLRVLFDGQPGEVSSTAPIEGQPGRYQIRAVVPRDVSVQPGSVREVPVALATPDSFTDLADLLVTRQAAP
jgi:uncharacterized protein (TIGR03437 family)